MDWLIYIGYVAVVALVVALSIKLGKYVDVIDAKSNVSGAFIGGVMLAAVTSLPELFTSLSAVWIVRENSLVIGNILGSDLINMAFLGLMLILFGKGLKNAEFNKFYYVGIIVTACMYGLVALGLYFGEYLKFTWYSLTSPVILVLYILFIYKTPKTSEPESEGNDKDEKISLKQAIVRFAICAVILIGASIAMTYLTDMVADKLELGKTFAGALFLGVATSLPELISSSTLCIRGNYNAAAGNIVGSNVFNFLILFVADVFSFGKNASDVYLKNADSVYLLILGLISSAVMFVMMLVKNRKKHTGGTMAIVQTLNVVMIAMYIVFLLLSTGVIKIAL